jgi:paraquat-inducible protein A
MRNLNAIYLLLVITGAILFVVSLFSPFVSVQKFYIFDDTITLVSMLINFAHEKDWFLFVVILLFTIVLPAVKFVILFIYGWSPDTAVSNSLSMRVLEGISKWAMLDVFLVAIVITVLKLDLVTTGKINYGLYLFVCSILLSIGCVQMQKLFSGRL